LARELGIDIRKVPGSGPRGRISLDDVKNYARAAISGVAAPVSPAMPAVRPLPDFAKWGPVKPEPMTGIRKKTGQNLSYTWSSVPQVTQYGRADATELMEFRREYSKRVEQAGGKLTIASILVKVVASALKVFPKFNASVDPGRGQIIFKEYYNIGVAVDTERGLLVPVIRDVDKKNVLQLSVELTALAEKARTGKIGPAEVTGGNFTVSNLGGIAGTYFAPILNWPEVALLGIGRAHQEPVYVNEQLQPRWILPLSLSYDHRIIDGADGARFIKWIIQALEQPFLLAVQE
jgi:pyruvate dehydrogenase E2 component (dihydrolipoamide acetyltransferase)